ncbi:amino acid ABC transporter substrate-binding protein [Aeromonas simiae]|uniref:Amino acid ABC transporter substrate-binding protein n=1 Tax=Aeromonas simiae TaxID=218936 RepID=A0A5J6WWG3_9GAMM|nr:amino acid ABC transporter substrate-binding protein [Aeromonas simiae]MDO2947031.1 amino acid ABC transporter substrate-binding protein [Aeromonas simiae]MDO2950643.1 amino acid ABC transporter substrate-binding protein [Aeromonas simiae]MDO2954375.1 amino acid ABC transporter substrate-binding protein [Aeromonas simiae]QFI55312.1 amino acid ABC transporter substrate-binding protein [Aeromonas simiae]
MTRMWNAGIAALLALTSAGKVWAAESTLDSVKKKGFVQCGVSDGLPGFSNPDAKGVWQGMDVDVCRAVAAAVLGDAGKVKYVSLTAKERFTALQSGEVDILSRNTTWTLTRDASLGLTFVGTAYYDGQGFLVNKSLGVKSAKELDGAAICIQSGTTTELNVADYFRANGGMKYTPVVFDTSDQTVKGFESGRCDVLTSDQSQLYALKVKLSKPEEAMVLPEVISKEPLGPAVRQGDDQWFKIVRWTLFAMLNAEEAGLTSTNVDGMLKSDNPDVRRLLGLEEPKGSVLGLDDKWAYHIIKQVGSYGEVFDRNVGSGSPLKIDRGINALWNKGGFMYAPPVR